MKKKLFFLAVAGFALASCSNDETVASQVNTGANEISFRPLMNNVTRATSLTTTDFSGGSTSFYVTATYATEHTAYFSNQEFKWNSTNSKYEPYTGTAFTTIYWPTSNLDFHAYACNGAASQVTVSNTAVANENGCPQYTVTPNTAAANQTDFVYATLTNQAPNTGNMALTFGHKESQIGVVLKNTDAALKITVSEVAICNIAQSGVFKNRNANPSTATTMEWGEFGAVTNYVQSITPAVFTDAAAAGTTWILIPHTLAKPVNDDQYVSGETNAVYGGAYIKVKYKCQSATNNDVYFAGGSDSWVEGIWPISNNTNTTTWAAGTHYTYTIDLAGGGYYEQNQATPSGATLDRILNLNPITFATVTVSNWTGPNNTNVDM